MSFRKLILAVAFMVGCAALAVAQGTYTQIDYPGAVETQLTGINRAGQMVGLYVDSLGGHGFLLEGGTYTTIDYPGAQYSYLYGINDNGQMVGAAEPDGFLYDMGTETFSVIEYPGATATFPQAINNAGTVAGLFQHQKGRGLIEDGFELAGATYRKVELEGSTGTAVYGISGAGEMVGFSVVDGALVNFFESQRRFRRIALSVTPGAQVYGINPQGTAYVGSYEPVNGVTGFVYQNHALQALLFPGSITTVASGINAAGEVVGYFIDASDGVHGFTWTPGAGK